MIIYESKAGNPYMTYEALSERWGIHKDTVRNRVKEIQKEIERGTYRKTAIVIDEKIVRVSELVFFHYLNNRNLLKNSATRKLADPYDATQCAIDMGHYNRVVVVDESA